MTRRGNLCLAVSVVAVLAAPARAQPAADAVVQTVDAVGLTVGNLDRSIAFFRDVLSFAVVGENEVTGSGLETLEGVFGAHVRNARLKLGGESIVLTEYLAPRGRPIPGDARSNDRGFQHLAIVVSDMDRAYRHLREHGVKYVSTEPQTLPAWNKAAAGIKAFYFADPDEHTLEVIFFPPGKGDPRWQAPSTAPSTAQSTALFLGIDHTAIGVGDTARSLRFYRDALGFRVAGQSDNHGTEQEHLNGVFGAHLRITALRAKAGPGIEFLEYLTPRDGRPAPSDLRANDLSHWQTFLKPRDVAAAVRGAVAAGGTQTSAAVVELDDPLFKTRKAVLARDPDGHGLLFTQ